MNDVIVKVNGLSKSYGKQEVLKHVSFVCQGGSIHICLGFVSVFQQFILVYLPKSSPFLHFLEGEAVGFS